MKKNKMMRIASVLLIVTILSTCAISGTFAKYITTGEGEDSARVAKWGINIAMAGDKLFADKYEYSTTPNPGRGYAVKSSIAEDQVVAPGTSSEEAGGTFKAVISGTPEVAVRYSLSFDEWHDIILAKGSKIKDETVLASTYDAQTGEFTYEDYPTTGTLTEDYTPVKFTIKFVGDIGGAPANSNGGNNDHTGTYEFPAMSLTDWDKYVQSGDAIPAISYNGVSAYAADGALNFDVPAGKSIEGYFECSWAWDFDNNGAGTNDILDTYLGNHAEEAGADGEPIGELSFKFTATAVQID